MYVYVRFIGNFGKEVDESKFSTFESNYLVTEAYAKETSKALQLNKWWYDCTEEEYAAFASGNNSLADEVEEEQDVYAEVLFSEAVTKQALYTCSKTRVHCTH